MKLGIGTAQFGMRYGLAGASGPLAAREVRAILQYAARRNVAFLDTAPAYEASESILGRALWRGHPMQIVTKTPAFGQTDTVAQGRRVIETFERSLGRLNQARIYGLLVHDSNDLLGERGEQIHRALEKIKASGRCSKIGASVYDAGQIDAILDRFPIDLIQLPLSLLDQRLLSSGHLQKLKERQVEIHARSVFLQGLLLMDPATLAARFAPIRPRLVEYNTYLEKRGRSRLDAAIGFVKRIEQVDGMIIGVDNLSQLTQVVSSFSAHPPRDQYRQFRLNDSGLVDPRTWVP